MRYASMIDYVFVGGLIAAAILLVMLAATLADRRLGFWPTPEKITWKNVAFWSLFRTLNIAVLVLALAAPGDLLSLPRALKHLALAIFAVSGGLYLYALFALGRANTYCRSEGLVTAGIYRWTRNPQYATVIATYAAVAVAADSGAVYILAAALIAVYVLMAHAEEPWLVLHYGDAYARYARAVPRFFGVRRLRLLVAFLLPARRSASLNP